jgi:hypothetical protein
MESGATPMACRTPVSTVIATRTPRPVASARVLAAWGHERRTITAFHGTRSNNPRPAAPWTATMTVAAVGVSTP